MESTFLNHFFTDLDGGWFGGGGFRVPTTKIYVFEKSHARKRDVGANILHICITISRIFQF